jgi:adenylate kinase family enzyme
MKIINLWGAPGAGKSTVAAGLFYKMKVAGYKVELVTEYAKDVVWDNRDDLLKDQLYLLAKQNRKLERLRGKVDWCITDSPVLLVLAYMPEKYYSHFNSLTYDVWESYTNLNYLLRRSHEYKHDGRLQTEDEAEVINDKIWKILIDYDQAFTPIYSKDAAATIFNYIENIK